MSGGVDFRRLLPVLLAGGRHTIQQKFFSVVSCWLSCFVCRCSDWVVASGALFSWMDDSTRSLCVFARCRVGCQVSGGFSPALLQLALFVLRAGGSFFVLSVRALFVLVVVVFCLVTSDWATIARLDG